MVSSFTRPRRPLPWRSLGRTLVSLTDAAVSGLAAINGSVSSVGEQLEVQMQRTRGEAATTGAWLVRAAGAVIFGGGFCRWAGNESVNVRRIADASLCVFWCTFNSGSGCRRGAPRATCVVPPISVGVGVWLGGCQNWIVGFVGEIRSLFFCQLCCATEPAAQAGLMLLFLATRRVFARAGGSSVPSGVVQVRGASEGTD